MAAAHSRWALNTTFLLLAICSAIVDTGEGQQPNAESISAKTNVTICIAVVLNLLSTQRRNPSLWVNLIMVGGVALWLNLSSLLDKEKPSYLTEGTAWAFCRHHATDV